MPILATNRFDPPIDPALLDRVAVLANQISDLKRLLGVDEKTRNEALRTANELRLTNEANDRVRDRIMDLENQVLDLQAEVRR